MPKFFVSPEQIYDDEILVLGNDAKHITLSLRMKVGDPIVICNTNKRDYECIISSIDSGVVKAEIISSSICQSEPPFSIKLYQCLPKGDKFEYIIQKSVELGVSSIVPVFSSRCIAKPVEKSKEKKNNRYNKISYEAASQSGRGIIPVVYDCINLERAFEIAANDGIAFICYEENNSLSLKKYLEDNLRTAKINSNISFFIGPEGGFSKDEIELAREYGIKSIGLGKRILRTETASSYVLSVLSYVTEL